MKDLTVGNEGKQIFYFTLPMLLGNVFQQLYSLINSAVVGRFVGKEALAAVGASFPYIFALVSLVIGITIGGTIIISQHYGAKNYDAVKKTIDTLSVFLFIASIITTILGLLLSGKMLMLIKLPKEIIPDAKLYLNIYFFGLIGLFGFNGISAILRGMGDSKTPLYFLIFSNLVNIGLDLLFILVFKWGVAGAATATIISQSLIFIFSIIYLNKKHPIIQFSLKNISFDLEIFKQCIRIGMPSGIQQTLVALGAMFIMGIVNKFGTDVIAAYSVAIRIDSLASLPAMNFAAALTTFVGQNIGANKIYRVKAGYRATVIMSSAFSVFITLIVLILGHHLLSVFTTDPNVIRIGHQYLIIISSFYIVFSIMFVNNGVLRGAGDTIIPMFITLFSLWFIRVPLAYFLSGRFGEKGIWWSVPVAWLIGMTVSYIYYLSGHWKNKSVIKRSEGQ